MRMRHMLNADSDIAFYWNKSLTIKYFLFKCIVFMFFPIQIKIS